MKSQRMRGVSRRAMLGAFALAGIGCFVITALALHRLQPGLSPLDQAVSYYVHGPHGWLLTVGLIGLGLGSLALTVGITLTERGPGMWAGRCFLGIWSVCVMLGGIFAADPPGHWDKPPSTSGMIHGGVAIPAFLALPIAAWLLSRSFRHDVGWTRLSAVSFTLTAAMVASLIAFALSLAPVFVTDGPPRLLGLTERILLAVNSVWLCVIAFALLRVGAKETSGDRAVRRLPVPGERKS
jgi:hypothetical membrane protein